MPTAECRRAMSEKLSLGSEAWTHRPVVDRKTDAPDATDASGESWKISLPKRKVNATESTAELEPSETFHRVAGRVDRATESVVRDAHRRGESTTVLDGAPRPTTGPALCGASPQTTQSRAWQPASSIQPKSML